MTSFAIHPEHFDPHAAVMRISARQSTNMSEETLMKSDTDIKRDVDAELKWNPEVDETDIATKVTGGAVTLSGFARDYYEKHQAEVTVKRVVGVTAVANDLGVRPKDHEKLTDPEIAREALAALKLALPITWDAIKPLVHEGRIVLEGTVEWNFLREKAESAVRSVRGVQGVRNSIRVQPVIVAGDIKQKIEAAFKRNAQVDSDHVTVSIRGPEVTLSGEVRSWAERDQATQTAWSAPGVSHVIDEMTVRT
jgi:osmotically-inducible protein OsmY